MMLGMGPKEWLLSVMCFAKLDVLGLCLKAVSCSLKRVANFLPVCPMYALWQSGQVSLYIPDLEYLSGGVCLWVSNLPIVFVVRKAIFRSVFLNRFVMYVVSLPM